MLASKSVFVKHYIQIYLVILGSCQYLLANETQMETEQQEQVSQTEQDYATDSGVDEIQDDVAKDAQEIQTASAKSVRQFHNVLDDLLSEFGYDIKLGQLKGLKNIAIRKVDVSEAIPSTYKKYTQMLVLERIRKNSSVKIINCLPCSSKTSRLIAGKVVITSPATNVGELKLASETLGIDHFMDIVLMYHATHMVLAFQIFKSDSKETVWAKSYNSETIRSRYQKLAIDYSQIKKSRKSDKYEPEFRILFGLGGSVIPNVAGNVNDSSMVALNVRSTERFDRRRYEFGLESTIYVTLASIIPAYPVVEGTGDSANSDTTTQDSNTPDTSADFENPAQPQPYSTGMGLFGIFSYNFLGSIESYNQLRHALHVGGGVILAPGYIAPTLKLGWNMFFGRKFALSSSLLYLTGSQILLENEFVPTTGGAGAEVILSYNY